MSRYRSIHCLIWSDDKFPFMSDDVKLVWFHVLTSYYSNQIGIFKASLGTLADEIRWDRKRYRDAISHAISHGMLDVCEKHQIIYVKNFLKYNPPTSPNSYKKWNSILEDLPECKLKFQWYQSLEANNYNISSGILDGILDAISMPSNMGCPIQEQEQEQEQENKDICQVAHNLTTHKNFISHEKIKLVTTAVVPGSLNSKIASIFEHWKKTLNHPKAKLDKKRKRILMEAINNYSMEELKKVPDGCLKSDWHMGRSPKNPGHIVDSIEILFKDSDHIERMISFCETDSKSLIIKRQLDAINKN